jgi:pimeloyl-ACP methyl ester carboxylesterase
LPPWSKSAPPHPATASAATPTTIIILGSGFTSMTNSKSFTTTIPGGGDGERILRAALDYLHARGVRRVYLACLSNGAAGVSALAPKLASVLSGLVLISGAPAGGTAGQLPALVIHGERDRIASAAAARAFATRAQGRYVGLDGGHLVLLMRRAQAREAMASWLRQREGSR